MKNSNSHNSWYRETPRHPALVNWDYDTLISGHSTLDERAELEWDDYKESAKQVAKDCNDWTIDVCRQAAQRHSSVMKVLERYVPSDRIAIESYLLANEDIVDVLREAVPHIEMLFGGNVQINLELIADPEYDDPSALYASVLTSIDVDAAIEYLRQFRVGWWNMARLGLTGLLSFNVEFT